MTHISVIQRAAARPRLEKIARMLEIGMSQSEIARSLGLSRERIRQLVEKAKREGVMR